METYIIENLTFSYPGKKQTALNNIDFHVPQGQFITVCGKSGCGKSTLLRQLKTGFDAAWPAIRQLFCFVANS